MHCPVCSNEVDAQSAFCGHCGASMAGAAVGTGAAGATGAFTDTGPVNAGPASATYTSVPAYAATPMVAANPGLSENAASAIAYLTVIPAIVFLVLEPFNRMALVRFHAWQSIGLTVAAILLQIVISICEVALHFIPGIFLLFSLVHLVVGLGLFLVWLLVIFKASKGEWYKLPVIGDFAQKQARG